MARIPLKTLGTRAFSSSGEKPFDRHAVIAAAKRMKDRRWRESATEACVVRAAPGVWISVTPCGPHISTLNAGLVALTCRNCRIEPAEAPNEGDNNHA
ncbi:hypothetical protein [Microbacterium maritypicum]